MAVCSEIPLAKAVAPYVTSPLGCQPVLEHVLQSSFTSALLTIDFKPRFGPWQDASCSVCLESYSLHETIVAFPCNHFLHERCFQSLVAQPCLIRTCPQCRAPSISAWAARAVIIERHLHQEVVNEQVKLGRSSTRTLPSAAGSLGRHVSKTSDQCLLRAAARLLIHWRNRLLLSSISRRSSIKGSTLSDRSKRPLGSDTTFAYPRHGLQPKIVEVEIARAFLLADKVLEMLLHMAVETDDCRIVDWLISRAATLWNHIARLVTSIGHPNTCFAAQLLEEWACKLATLGASMHANDYPAPTKLNQHVCAQDVFEALKGYGVGARPSQDQRRSQYTHLCAVMVRAMKLRAAGMI